MPRAALITGGVSGLGRAAAIRLEADGVKVITLDVADGAGLVVDVTDPDAVQAVADAAGPIDVLVNSAGVVGPSVPLWEVPIDGWRRTFEVNVNGTFPTCRAFVPGMRERGWGRAIAPAVIETPMNAGTAPDALAHLTSPIPMRRAGKAAEVAELIAWPASDKVSFSTGAVYDISGGRATY
ncbi:3-oxoacyl-[acyl-carrier protein] reductase [[Actinomadura] parvosata subsp. kistnae]|uniref:3-oxoacyl-ACP reductase n=1 Tax=[Actinomadura] parvosata subsp. kistnae TaxID=1909395 RepID=A0A1U9ZV02_9ACTN|nr:SDR family oxidoreductase [Nonomuraea sp. ATCC 55076]AQZ61786.1 3-oxoacyl-ACP reductase [Nonomuraea sp. ATCC 55076]SPL87912.1 3-oxoacyl-[acyl-carrier protein] reductase [Actinomadura parvosata subsp. kistnae]